MRGPGPHRALDSRIQPLPSMHMMRLRWERNPIGEGEGPAKDWLSTWAATLRAWERREYRPLQLWRSLVFISCNFV